MTIKIPRRNWARFLEDLGKRRFEWRTRIEVIGKDIGDQILDHGMPLMGITAVDGRDGFIVEVSLGGTVNSHLSHSIANPVGITYMARQGKAGGVIEVEEFDRTKTLIHIEEPMMSVSEIGDDVTEGPFVVV